MPVRRTSVSLPTSKTSAHDPYEKANRYKSRGARDSAVGTLEKIQSAWMTQSQRSRYLKTGGLLFFVLFLFYYLSPSGTSSYDGSGSKAGPVGGQTPSDSSYGTTKCKQSFDKSKPIIQYALMVDAGSTGSRIHVYRFNNCGPTPELENEGFKQTVPKPGGSGLSSFKADAEGAAKSLDMLLDLAMEQVPDSLKSCTPIAVKATAGLRGLGKEMSDKILDAVRKRLETKYPFPVVSKEERGVEVMEGSDEGVYAWITTNYLLGTIARPDHSPTVAVLDLGGGSTQVVFEPTFKLKKGGIPEKMAPGDHIYKLSFGGRDFELYQHSHLGYGLMTARKTIHKTLIEDILSQSPEDSAWFKKPVINPCIAPGMVSEVELEFDEKHALGPKISVNMTGPSTPAPAQCRALVEKMLAKDAACNLAPCSFNGIHQPSLERTFSREDIYTISYFFDRTKVLGMPDSFTLSELHRLTDQVCSGEKAWDVFENVPGAILELKGRGEHCLDLSYMVALLRTGYEMPTDREVKIAKQIKGKELGWALGASLPLLSKGSGWTCRVKQIA